MYIIYQGTKIEITHLELYRVMLKLDYEFQGMPIPLHNGSIVYRMKHKPSRKLVKLVLE